MLHTREYGTDGPVVIAMHGGPGAPGTMAPVARGLAETFRVVEPFQRRRTGTPLAVSTHVADLHELIGQRHERRGTRGRGVLVGSSWGAMLALAYAAAWPETVGPIVLVGCGTFDRASRTRMHEILDTRMTPSLRRALQNLEDAGGTPDERLARMGELLLPIYSHDPITTELELAECDARGHTETWSDMIRLQDDGTYPAAFAAIRSPVLMLHGEDDPHPGSMIRDSLHPFLPQLEYHSYATCGHYPWLERAVREEFFAFLQDWLTSHVLGPDNPDAP